MAVNIVNKDLQAFQFQEGSPKPSTPVTYRPTRPLLPISVSPATLPNNGIQNNKIKLATAITATDSDPYLFFRGTWQSFIVYNINDVVVQNLSTYVAIQSSVGSRPDQNTQNWTILGENLVFNPSTGTIIQTGGFSLHDTGAITVGGGTTFSVSATPSKGSEIALLTLALSNNGNSPTSIPGYTFITERSGAWSYWYKLLDSSGAAEIASGTLSISDDWIAALDFFQFGGFASVSASQVTVNAANQITILVGNASGLLVAGQVVLFTNFVGASFLNGSTMTISTANATTITGTIGAGHANYGPTADSGTVSVILQQISAETSGALFPPVSTNFSNPTRVSDIIVITAIAVGIFSGGGQLGGYSDGAGNTYAATFAINTIGGAHFTLNQAYSTPNKSVFSGANTLTIGSGSDLTSAGYGAIELAGSAAVPQYEPYDVVQFKGSMFVCLLETTNDAFVQPAAWALIGPSLGYVDILTADYTAVATDAGRLLSMNSSGAHTITLPSPIPAPPAGTSETGWMVFIQNIGTGTLTIARNGLTIDGAAANLTLGQNQGVLIFADGTGNYETLHGMNSLVVPNVFTVTVPNGSGQVTIGLATEAANTVWAGPTSGGAATPTFRLLANGDLPVTVPVVPPEFTISGNVASPAGSLVLDKATEAANTVWAGPTSGGVAKPTFRPLVSADIPGGAALAVVSVSGTLITTSLSGNLRINGAVPPAGLYRISMYVVLAANPAAGTLGGTFTWNDPVQGQTTSPATISTSVLGNVAQTDVRVVSDGIHDITWSITLA